MDNKLIESNVTGTRIKFNNGIAWKVGNKEYHYGWAYVKTVENKFCDILHAPIGYEMQGDILEVTRTYYEGDSKFQYTEIVFQPYGGTVTDAQSLAWNKAHWIECFGNDDHFYQDVESVTYTDPKTGTIRKDKVYNISIQQEVNVIVYRQNGGRSTTLIPIKNIIERHLINSN